MDDEPKDEEPITHNGITVIIPKCCREGRDDCPHSVQKVRPEKTNIGL